jgi:Uncharacterized protein conserved in bacteria (DUF2344)
MSSGTAGSIPGRLADVTGRSDPAPEPAPPVAAPREPVQRWRLVLGRAALGQDEPQRAQLAAWEDALRACGLPLAGLDADPPRPRVAIAAPLASSVEGEAELVDIWLVERWPGWRVREAVRACLPDGFGLRDVHDVWLGEASLPGQVVASVYRAELDASDLDEQRLRDAVAAILLASALPRARRKGDRAVGYDLRPFLDDVQVGDPDAAGRIPLRMVLMHDPEKGIGRPEELLAEIGDRMGVPLFPVVLVRERLELASERARAAAQQPGGPPGAPRTRRRRGG